VTQCRNDFTELAPPPARPDRKGNPLEVFCSQM
jgi:hypothetical protein